jgi:hypothetical protein
MYEVKLCNSGLLCGCAVVCVSYVWSGCKNFVKQRYWEVSVGVISIQSAQNFLLCILIIA